MKIERRDFFKTTTAAFALALTSQGKAMGQNPKKSSGELRAGSGTLYLEGELKSGLLKLEAQDFLDRKDRSVIIRGSLGSVELYSAMFSYQDDASVFALFHDNGHSTIVVLSNSDDPKVGSAVVWNDNETPQVLNFEKAKILAADEPQSIHDLNGTTPNWLGKRNPPAFTWKELMDVFGSDPELLAFMRGKKASHKRASDHEWMCWMLSNVPGSLHAPPWEP